VDIRIIEHLDYREIIKNLCKKTKISQKNLALSAGIHTSYFSRVMTGGADFSSSQLYLIASDLGISGWELDYFLLLGEYWSSSHHSHKQHLLSKIKDLQKKHSKVISKMKDVETEMSESYIREYYAEAVTAKIHMLLTIDKYQKNPMLICNKILIPEFKLKLELEKLSRIGVIKEDKGEWKVLKFNVHLDESSAISPQNHINWRLESIQNIQKRTPRPSDYHMSAVFSTDENGKLKIKEMFKEFVVEAQKVAGQVKDQEDVYHISFDLF
jgi:uncharacterized protein (TIGR02147 family)